jgi:hypothetical protein
MFRITLIILIAFLLSSCEEEPFEAESMIITQLSLTKVSFQNSFGSNWDDLSNPDIFIKLTESGTTNSLKTSTFQDISSNGLPLVWELKSTFTLNDFNNNLVVSVYDEDVFTDDLISTGTFSFDPFEDYESYNLILDETCEILIDVKYK